MMEMPFVSASALLSTEGKDCCKSRSVAVVISRLDLTGNLGHMIVKTNDPVVKSVAE